MKSSEVHRASQEREPCAVRGESVPAKAEVNEWSSAQIRQAGRQELSNPAHSLPVTANSGS